MATLQGIEIHTDKERYIFKHYESEKSQRKELEEMVKNLTSQIAELQREIKDMRERYNAPSIPPRKVVVPPPEVYETEEELARETEWVRQKSRKKRKLNKSPSPLQDSCKNKDINEKPKLKKLPLPPPIVVESVKKYQQFYDFLSASVNKDTFLIKMMSGDIVKINANNDDSYRAITKLLTQRGCLWHSYENKQDRPIRVMAKNLHSSCEPDRIVEDLTVKGLYILNAVNKLSWKDKQPLNMFILSFGKDEDIKKIYEIKSILGCKVDMQPLKSTKLIPQFKRCQSYGHTQKYCSKEPRCVKCTGKHLTKDCNKSADTKPKCVHCGGAHPASYRGCIVAKELQHIRNKQTKKTHVSPVNNTSNKNGHIQTPTTRGQNYSKEQTVSKKVAKDISYAQMAKSDELNASSQPHQKNTSSDKLNQILNLMTSFDERLRKLEKSTMTAKVIRKSQ